MPRLVGLAMRALPRDIDADAVIAIGQYLDEQAPGAPLSIRDAIPALRRCAAASLSEEALLELIVEMCATRRISVLFDGQSQVGSDPVASSDSTTSGGRR